MGGVGPLSPPISNPGPPGEPDILNEAARWREEGHCVALATVIATWGSSPRPIGAQLALDDSGRMVGSVSGGCIEGAVAHEAAQVMKTGAPKLLEYGVSDETAWSVGLACGGTIRVFVERVESPEHPKRVTLDALRAARVSKIPVALITDLQTGHQALIDAETTLGPLALDAPTLARARAALAEDNSGILEGTSLFIHVHNPPLRMIVVGAVHIAQALVPMATLAGYDVTVIDPRRAWATPERFPGVRIVSEWPDEAMRAIAPDRRTAVVALTHDPKLDDPALIAALASPAFYVGALGSTRTHAKRLARLAEAGLDEAAMTRIHGPIGLPIGARSPAEIAISILAETIQTLHGAAPLIKAETAA